MNFSWVMMVVVAMVVVRVVMMVVTICKVKQMTR